MDQKEQLYDGLNKQLYRITGLELNETGSAVAARLFPVSTEDVVNSWADMGSGVFSGNVEVGGGYIQSGNFIAGTTGWKLSADGTLEAVDAILSGTINATSGTIGGTTISSTALTGGIIQTSSSGVRIVISGTDNTISFRDGSTLVGEIDGTDVTGSIVNIDYRIYRPGETTESAAINMRTNETGGSEEDSIHLRVGVLDGIRGIDIEYADADGFAKIDINGRFSSDLDPEGPAAQDIGDATNYWDDINYKTLTDRGCLGWYDDGVELQDGRVVSDIEALLELKPHPTLKTPAGAARIDYRTMPKHVYRPADDKDENGKRYKLARDEDDRPYKMFRGKKVYAQDGAETTALISILLGAIKEVNSKCEELNKEVEKLRKSRDNK